MKSPRCIPCFAHSLFVCLLAVAFPLVALAQQEVVIEAFDSAGQLTFSPVENAAAYRIEWAPSVYGPWTNFVGDSTVSLNELPPFGPDPVTVSVPMLYRVVATVTNPPSVDFTVLNSGASAYLINGESNPTLDLIRGETYVIEVNASGHPFWIKTAATTGTGNQYNDGVTGNGVAVGEIVFAVPMEAPDTLYYICQFHGAMQGVINITGGLAP